MMEVPPGAPFDLVMPSSTTSVPVINLDSQKMEEQALWLRPELRAVDYKKRITQETVKVCAHNFFESAFLQAKQTIVELTLRTI